MAAAHVVGNDLQLWLGVDPGLLTEQQVSTELGRIGALRRAGHLHGAVENAVGAAIHQRFLQLIQAAIGAIESHQAVQISNGRAIEHRQIPQAGFCAASALQQLRLLASQGPTLNHGGAAVGAAGLLANGTARHQHSAFIALEPLAFHQLGAGSQLGFDPRQAKAGSRATDPQRQLQLGVVGQQETQPRRQQRLGSLGLQPQLQTQPRVSRQSKLQLRARN